MKKILFRTVFFCLSVFSLCSCRQDDETERSNESGDLVAVNIPIEGVRVESADSPLIRGGSAEPLTVTEELEDGFVLETSLLPVSAGLTIASSTTSLASDVQVLAIAYKESGELYKCQYFTSGSPVIHLPKGERFKLVFYSYNSTTKPDISKDITGSVSHITNGVLFSETAFLNDKTEIHTNNVMWGRIDLTPVISSGINLPGVRFTHLFSRLDWRLQSVVGVITECSSSVRNTYKNGTIKLGNLVNAGEGSNSNDTWVGARSADYAAPVSFDAVGSTDITSRKTVFCPSVGQDIVLGLDRIVFGDKTFADKHYVFPTKLKRGIDYHAVSTIKRRMTVTFSAAVGGTVTPEGAQTVDTYGSVVTSTAATSTGYKFDGWYRDGIKVTTENGVVVNNRQLMVTVSSMTEGKAFEARFSPEKFAVTFQNTYDITVTPSGRVEGFRGDQVTSIADNPKEPYKKFDGWYRVNSDGLRLYKITSADGPEAVTGNTLRVTLNTETDGAFYRAFGETVTIEYAPGILAWSNGKYTFDISSVNRVFNKNIFFCAGERMPIQSDTPFYRSTNWNSLPDLCREVDYDGGGWRLPTQDELINTMFVYNRADNSVTVKERIGSYNVVESTFYTWGSWGPRNYNQNVSSENPTRYKSAGEQHSYASAKGYYEVFPLGGVWNTCYLTRVAPTDGTSPVGFFTTISYPTVIVYRCIRTK